MDEARQVNGGGISGNGGDSDGGGAQRRSDNRFTGGRPAIHVLLPSYEARHIRHVMIQYLVAEGFQATAAAFKQEISELGLEEPAEEPDLEAVSAAALLLATHFACCDLHVMATAAIICRYFSTQLPSTPAAKVQ